MKSLLLRFIAIALFSAVGVTQSYVAEVPGGPTAPTATDLYELRVYMGYPIFDLSQREPEIKTQIEVGKYFFARNVLPYWPDSKSQKPRQVIYTASGVLHAAQGGKFALERTFMWWGQNTSSLTFGPSTMQIELGKPVSLDVSMGSVKGYTALLTKVTPPTESAPKEKEVPAPILFGETRP